MRRKPQLALAFLSAQLREFVGQGELVRDNDAFFLPINAETQDLIQIIRLAAVRANP